MDINEGKNFLIDIMQEIYVFFTPRIKKDISLLVGMGVRYDDSQRLISETRKRIEEVLSRKKMQKEDNIALIFLAIYNFYDLDYFSKYGSWFKFMYVTDFDKSKSIRAVYGNMSEIEIKTLLIDVLVASSRFFYAYNLDIDIYNEEIQQERDKDSKKLYDKINDDDFKNFFNKL